MRRPRSLCVIGLLLILAACGAPVATYPTSLPAATAISAQPNATAQAEKPNIVNTWVQYADQGCDNSIELASLMVFQKGGKLVTYTQPSFWKEKTDKVDSWEATADGAIYHLPSVGINDVHLTRANAGLQGEYKGANGKRICLQLRIPRGGVNLPESRNTDEGIILTLNNGSLLAVEGFQATKSDSKGNIVNISRAKYIERFDPTTGQWSVIEKLPFVRDGVIAAALRDGRALFAGGYDINTKNYTTTVILYDPQAKKTSPAEDMPISLSAASTVALADGRILVAGGYENDLKAKTYQTTAKALIFDPQKNTWQSVASMKQARAKHRAALLSDGRVLLVGGQAEGPEYRALDTSEIYDPKTDTWTTQPMHAARFNAGVSALKDGRVLVVGGRGSQASVNEIFDPATNAWAAISAPTATPRSAHSQTLLPDGRVLIAGGTVGEQDKRTCVSSVSIFDPKDNSFHDLAPLKLMRIAHYAAALPDGSVMLIGGGPCGSVNGVYENFVAQERYDVAKQTSLLIP